MTWWYPIPSVTTMSRGYSADHRGIDFATVAPDPPLPPTPVYASDGGTVIQADDEELGFGNVVVLQRPDGWRSLYGHLSRIDVARGQTVIQGQQLGLSGGGSEDDGHGGSTGRHLHFQIMSPGGATNSENTVDPAPLLTMPPSTEEDDVSGYYVIHDGAQYALVDDYWVDGQPMPLPALPASVAVLSVLPGVIAAMSDSRKAFRESLAPKADGSQGEPLDLGPARAALREAQSSANQTAVAIATAQAALPA